MRVIRGEQESVSTKQIDAFDQQCGIFGLYSKIEIFTELSNGVRDAYLDEIFQAFFYEFHPTFANQYPQSRILI